MAHQISEYLKYVTSITIENGGSGYSSVTPPVITISGGGGTGATATASVFNGEITDVNITNVGEGYSSEPTVTVTDSGGSGAVLTANVAFATVPSVDYDEKIAPSVKYTVPEFIREDYNQFITFIEKYYEYMDSDGNPINLLLNKDYSDIDELEDAELNKRVKELAKDFPQLLESDRRNTLKKIKNIYESKGSDRSIKAYFKLLYNEEVEVYYPSKNILRASDGIWIEETSVRATSGFNDYEVLNLNGMLADIKYYETIGSVTLPKTIEVTIPRVEKLSYTSPQAYEVVVELPPGITEIPGPGSQASASATVVGGEITEIAVTSEGFNYTAAPEVEIFDTVGSGAEARAVVADGKVTSIVIISGGSGYTGTNTTINLSVDNLRTFIVERGAAIEPANIRAYLDRSLAAVTTGSYVGSNAGFSVGDVFTINESGDDGAVYAVEGYFAENYTFTGGSNNAVIRVASIDENSVPTAWSIITPGEGFLNAETTINIESKTGEQVEVTIVTKYLYSYDGKYKDDRGKLSDVNRLQDNYKYQSFSYIIKSTISQNQWGKRFRDLMHPAGMEVFGDLIVSSNIDFSPFFTIQTDGLKLQEFKTEDVIVSTDNIFAVNYSKNLIDTTSYAVEGYFAEDYTFIDGSRDAAISTDLLALLVSITKSDSVVMNDSGEVTYFLEDYCDPSYCQEGGVTISVAKILDEDVSTLDVFVPVLEFERTFSELPSSSDAGEVTYFLEDYCDPSYCQEGGVTISVAKILSDSVSSITDNFLYEKTTPVDLSDSVSVTNGEITFELAPALFCNNPAVVSEIPVININKALVENQTATDVVTLITEKPFEETSNVSDGGVVFIQDYAPTYFAEDYVGENNSF